VVRSTSETPVPCLSLISSCGCIRSWVQTERRDRDSVVVELGGWSTQLESGHVIRLALLSHARGKTVVGLEMCT